MAIAKVILNGETQMDVTQKTVTAGSMLSGVTALKNDGTDITGDIESKSSSDLTASGATVTAPAGYYASAASKSVASGSATTPATTITANPTVSVNSSGLITATVSKEQSVTPSVSAGYVSSGTAGTITVSGSGTSQLTTQAAQIIHPSTTDQTIASGKYLTGAQTIKAVTVTNLTAENIVDGVTVKVGDSTDDDCVASVTGTASGGGGGGISGVAKGTLTVDATVSTSTSVDIATTTEIGFTPTKFFFYKDTNTGTDAVIYMSTYADIGSKYIRVRAIYDARNAIASVSGNYMNWTSSSSGCLYFSSNTVKISTSSSYKLEAGTYTWYAIQ